MQSAKAALLEAGRIEKIGRGRISLDNHAWLKAQHDSGVRFTDWPKGQVAETTNDDGEKEVRVKRDPANGNLDNYADVVYTFPENMYVAETVAGKHVGMREVCNNCRVSLVQCHCTRPTILGDTIVVIKPKPVR